MNPAVTPLKLPTGVVKGQAATQSNAHRQDHAEAAPFAPLRHNNKVECFTTGKDYYIAISAAMKNAKKCIFIAGWQVNWDLELTPDTAPGERLIDILYERVHSSENLRVYVMPWMSPKVGLDTYDLDTMLAIFQLNAGRKTMQAMCCPAGAQSDYIGTEGAAFSHHQKFVVIDNEKAFVGGIDLAYGRYDDATFSLDPGARRFNERYNPGVKGSHHCIPADGASLSYIDLMSTTLTAGRWNAGGNSEPGRIAKALHYAMDIAKATSLEAVVLVNQADKVYSEIAQTVHQAGVDGATQLARAGAHDVAVTADIAMAAANAVSRQCASLNIPDLYGAVKAQQVGHAATSRLPETLRQAEVTTRKEYNEGIDALAHFLSPLTALRVSPDSQSPLPHALESAERVGRSALNVTIDVGAAMAGRVQQIATGERTVCVEIGPALQSGVEDVKAIAQAAARTSPAAAHTADKAIDAGINILQRGLIAEINNVRAAINSEALAFIAWGDHAADIGLQNLSQAKVQAVLDRLMHLCKMFYVAQLSMNWTHAAAHPWLMKNGGKANSTKTAPKKGLMLGSTQPRQPWQDVQVQIEGPAADDLAMNFIGRWNACHTSYVSAATFSDLNIVDSPIVASWVAAHVRNHVMIQGDLVPPRRPPEAPAKPTGVAVRVLRSAPLKLCTQEALARKDKVMPLHEQHEITSQMINLIANATDFVYIENQFYQSEFGHASIDVMTEAGDKLASGPIKVMMDQRGNRLKAILSSAGFAPGTKLMPANGINAALGDRIAQAVRRDQPFHVYLVLPVHPEGMLNDIAIAGQVHWTMQSLVFADQSLVNRVRRAIAARRLCKNTLSDAAWKQAMADAGKVEGNQAPYQLVEEKQWCKYLTLLNLRNCQTVGGVVRTEQIYIHSKLLIVDDRHVIVGSANINDRSQSGKRDSELAVMLFDSAEEQKTIRDRVTTVNTLARNLRCAIWNKHFAITGQGNDIVKPASVMKDLIERPAADETIEAIQKLAFVNAGIYTKVFAHIPWTNTSADKVETGASLWPVCRPDSSKEEAELNSEKMPFHARFWNNTTAHVQAPHGIMGYFTKLPTNWTIGENNHPGQMSVMALTLLETTNGQAPKLNKPNAPSFNIA